MKDPFPWLAQSLYILTYVCSDPAGHEVQPCHGHHGQAITHDDPPCPVSQRQSIVMGTWGGGGGGGVVGDGPIPSLTDHPLRIEPRELNNHISRTVSKMRYIPTKPVSGIAS